MSRRKNTKDKERIPMAVMTAKCDRPFVVASEKSKIFRKKVRDENNSKKIDFVVSKIENNINTDKTSK